MTTTQKQTFLSDMLYVLQQARSFHDYNRLCPTGYLGSGRNGANLSRISERFRIREQAFDILN